RENRSDIRREQETIMGTGATRLRVPGHYGNLIMAPVIAVVAVTTVALAASSSVFLIAGLCIALAVVAVLRFEWFVYAQIFLFPWYPFLDINLPLHDVSLVLRFLLFAGVFLVRGQNHKSVAQWILGGRIRKGVIAFAVVATASLLFSSL